jgi:hypothetical protein
MMETKVEIYKGQKISRDEDGFFWRKDGYFESVERCRLSIDDDIAQDEEFYGHLNVRDDTDCLTQPYWER